MKSWATAVSAASTTCSAVISGLPEGDIFQMEPLKRKSLGVPHRFVAVGKLSQHFNIKAINEDAT